MSVLNWKIDVYEDDGELKSITAVHNSNTYEIEEDYEITIIGHEHIFNLIKDSEKIGSKYGYSNLCSAMCAAHKDAFGKK